MQPTVFLIFSFKATIKIVHIVRRQTHYCNFTSHKKELFVIFYGVIQCTTLHKTVVAKWYMVCTPLLIPVAARSKAQVCGRLPAEIVGSNPAGGIVVCLSVSVVCCQVEVSAMGRSLIQRSPADCGGSLCVIQKHQEQVLHIYMTLVA